MAIVTFNLFDDSAFAKLFADLVEIRWWFEVLFETISQYIFKIAISIDFDQRAIVVDFIE
jgi:hypothetical protein